MDPELNYLNPKIISLGNLKPLLVDKNAKLMNSNLMLDLDPDRVFEKQIAVSRTISREEESNKPPLRNTRGAGDDDGKNNEKIYLNLHLMAKLVSALGEISESPGIGSTLRSVALKIHDFEHGYLESDQYETVQNGILTLVCSIGMKNAFKK